MCAIWWISMKFNAVNNKGSRLSLICLRLNDQDWTLHSPLFFRKIVRTERLPVREAILVSYVKKSTEGVGVGVYSGGGREARKIPNRSPPPK